MKLSELLRELAYGELKNLSMASGGAIDAAAQPELVIYINDALLKLHSDFKLKEKDVLIEMQAGVTNYHLRPRYAESQYKEGQSFVPYIKDLADPFIDDVVKILSVYDGHIYGSAYGSPWNGQYAPAFESLGTVQDMAAPFLRGLRGDNLSDSLPLNDSEDPRSLFTPQAHVLQVPHPHPGRALGVQYQAKHLKLSETDPNAVIELPDVLFPALKAFVAHKTFDHMNGQENTSKAQEHLSNYVAICGDVIDKDLVSTSSSTTNIRFHKRGWV